MIMAREGRTVHMEAVVSGPRSSWIPSGFEFEEKKRQPQDAPSQLEDILRVCYGFELHLGRCCRIELSKFHPGHPIVWRIEFPLLFGNTSKPASMRRAPESSLDFAQTSRMACEAELQACVGLVEGANRWGMEIVA